MEDTSIHAFADCVIDSPYTSLNIVCFLFQLSMADTSIHAFIDTFVLKDKLDKCPRIAACIKKVEENKNIAKWLKERPVTER